MSKNGKFAFFITRFAIGLVAFISIIILTSTNSFLSSEVITEEEVTFSWRLLIKNF